MTLWYAGGTTTLGTLQEYVSVRGFSRTTPVEPFDTVLVDLDEPDGASIVDSLAGRCRVVVTTSSKSLSRVVNAVSAGAAKAIAKPIAPLQLDVLVAAEAEQRRIHAEKVPIMAWRAQFARGIVGNAGSLMAPLELAARAADTQCPILITGESGTGKELLAHAMHMASGRASGPYVAVNCPAIPKDLVESELFGHAKGAFTGATAPRVGRFVAAHGGTLFLDEIGEMDLGVQVKLLRVLQDFHVTPVGDTHPQRVDVRLIAATNRRLEQMAQDGTFREDLYYRLNVIEIHLPALRERREDIPLLVDRMVKQLTRGRAPMIGAEILAGLESYYWPGNIRQLRNVIERLCVLRPGEPVRVTDVPPCVQAAIRNRAEPALVQRPAPPPKVTVADGVAYEVAQAGRSEWLAVKEAALAAAGRSESLEVNEAERRESLEVNEAERSESLEGAAPTEAEIALLLDALKSGELNVDLKGALQNFEDVMIRKALMATGGNRNQAAKLLGLNRTTLVEKLRKRPLAATGT